jgi:hypothetical protein
MSKPVEPSSVLLTGSFLNPDTMIRRPMAEQVYDSISNENIASWDYFPSQFFSEATSSSCSSSSSNVTRTNHLKRKFCHLLPSIGMSFSSENLSRSRAFSNTKITIFRE